MSKGLRLCEIRNNMSQLKDIDKKTCAYVYFYDSETNTKFMIEKIRIDSKDDIVCDLKRVINNE